MTPYAASRLLRLPARLHAAFTGGPKAHRVPARWVRAPDLTASKPVCIFIALARDRRLLPHSVDLAHAWHEAGFSLVVVVVVSALDEPVDLTHFDFADAVLLRVNRGYDFGAWAAAIRLLEPILHEMPMLAIANDSVLGPSSNFAAVLEYAARSDADLIGLVESNELARHLQSFVLFFKAKAIRSQVFWRFWRSVRSGERQYVIDNYEIPLRGRFEAAGLRAEALFPIADGPWHNPTFITWRALVSAGFPFFKIELLRTAPWQVLLDGWRDHATSHGFDLGQIDRQLAELEKLSSFRWAYRDALQSATAPVAASN